jgi:secreted trypsin-like serine protease
LDDHWEQVGIASHTIDCVQFRNLGIYTRIVEYNGWIQSIISDCSTISPSPPPPTGTVIIESTTTVTKKAPVFYHCNKTSTCGCGSVPVILTPSRIVGGENALEYSWPMMASMRGIDINYHLCGGSILSSSYILTAAHCVQYLSELSANITFVVGMTNLSDQKQIRLNVDRVYVHPNYTGWQDGSRHDLALVHINPPLTFQNHPSITKTCIHRVDPPILNDQYIKTGTRLTVIGWGHLQENNINGPQILQQVEVHAIANDDPICVNSINDVQTQFCAGLPEGGKG